MRHTNQLCRTMPPLFLLTCKMDLVRIWSYKMGWQNDQIALWWLLWSCIWTTSYNKCSQKSPSVSMPTSISGTRDRHRLHPRCRWTCRFLLAYLWVVVEPSPIPSANDPTCWTSCMVCPHCPIGPTWSPNSVGMFLWFLCHTVDRKRWPSIDMPFIVSLSCRSSWVSSWI